MSFISKTIKPTNFKNTTYSTQFDIVCFSNAGLYVEDAYPVSQTVRQHVFIKDEFHYLNVSRVGSFTVYDIFDCTFECLSNPSCLSVNMAAFKEANGELWCELLSSDKYRNPKDYAGIRSSHHFSIMVRRIIFLVP